MDEPYIEYIPGANGAGQIYVTLSMYNRVGKKKNGKWGKDNDSVASVDLNLYWEIYTDIL